MSERNNNKLLSPDNNFLEQVITKVRWLEMTKTYWGKIYINLTYKTFQLCRRQKQRNVIRYLMPSLTQLVAVDQHILIACPWEIIINVCTYIQVEGNCHQIKLTQAASSSNCCMGAEFISPSQSTPSIVTFNIVRTLSPRWKSFVL